MAERKTGEAIREEIKNLLEKWGPEEVEKAIRVGLEKSSATRTAYREAEEVVERLVEVVRKEER